MLFSFVFSFGMLYIKGICLGIKFIDIENNGKDTTVVRKDIDNEDEDIKTTKDGRKYWLGSSDIHIQERRAEKHDEDDEKDERLKSKISTLVDQTLHDTENRIKSIQYLKEEHREEAPYKAGFILCMIKKAKDVLNELFNVAVKHRDDWKALEQLKIFELIVHTNVDTTNLVRQLVEIHIQHMNSTNGPESRKRVVLLK